MILDITTLIAHMGDVRLMDLDDGDFIMKKLTEAVDGDDKIFTIDLTGNQIKDKYIALPASVRNVIDQVAILDQAQWRSMLKDIQRITDNRSVISQKNDDVIEAYLGSVVWMMVFAIITTVVLYRCSTLDVKGGQDGIAKMALEHLIDNIARAELNESETGKHGNDNGAGAPPGS